MTIRFALCLLAGALVFALPALAQPACKHHSPNPQNKEFYTLHKQWVQENVFPVLQQWKQELDAMVAPEDLQQLNVLRAKAAELRTQKKTILTALHAVQEENDDKTQEELHDQLHAVRNQQRELATELRPLIEKYRDELHALHEQRRPTLEAWKKEQKQQWKNWLSQQPPSNTEELEQKHPHSMPSHGNKKRRVVQFLLWDGSLPAEQEATAPSAPTDSYNKPSMERETATPSLVQLSPNPAATHITLQFSLPTAGATTLTLYNTQGSIVATPLQQQYFQAGIHSVDIATQALASGAYRYTLENNGRVLAGTLYVNH